VEPVDSVQVLERECTTDLLVVFVREVENLHLMQMKIMTVAMSQIIVKMTLSGVIKNIKEQ